MFEAPKIKKQEGNELEEVEKINENPEGDSGKKERIEKECQEKIEKIQKLASDIKSLYDSFEDKTVLDKYLFTPSYDGGKYGYGSLHDRLYSVASWAGERGREGAPVYEGTSEEANDILSRIEEIAGKAVKDTEASDARSWSLNNVLESMDLLKSQLLVAARMEGKTEEPHSLAGVPEELRSAIYGYLSAGSESYIVSDNSELESAEINGDTATVKIKTVSESKVNKDKPETSATTKTLNFKKTERGWVVGV